MPAMTQLTRDYLKSVMAYVDHKLNAPQRLILGGTAGGAGGSGVPPGGVLGQLAQKYVCYDTDEATSSGSTAIWSGSSPSLIQNLNRIRGGWAIGDDAIRERHLFWSTACLAGTSGCIDAYHVPFFSACLNPETNVRDAIDWVYEHRGDESTTNYYTWHTFTFTFEGDLDVGTGDLKFYAPGTMVISKVYGSVGTAPVGQNAIFDVNKNGVSILDASRLVISDGTTTGEADPVTTTLALNDYITVDVDQRGTTTPGADAVVHVRCKQYLQED